MTSLAAKPPHPLTITAFRSYFFARLALTLGLTSLTLVVGYLAYNIARETMSVQDSAAMLGLIGLAQFVPLFLLTPITGWSADRYDRRIIARCTIALQWLVGAGIAAAVFADVLTLPLLFIAAVFLGIARAFSGPALSALAPNLVPREVLPTAIAVSSIAWQSGQIIGPAFGGTLIAIGPGVSALFSVVLFTLAFIGFWTVGPVPQPVMARDVHPIRQMRDGLAYVRGNRMVLATITLDLFAVLLAGATALLPVFQRDVLHVGPEALGLLAASMGIGAAAVAFLLSWRPLNSNVGWWMIGAVILFGLATIVFGLSRSLPLSVGALVVAGAADMVSVYVRGSLVQLYTPDEMRGRVSSVSQLTISASNELGEAESGLAAALIGPVGAVVVGGVAAIAITLVWAWIFPELRLAKSFAPPDIDSKHPSSTEQRP